MSILSTSLTLLVSKFSYKPRFPLVAVQTYSKLLNFDFNWKTISRSTWPYQHAIFSGLQKPHSFCSLSSQAHCAEVNGNESSLDLGVETISIDNIKPSVPTPSHLRTYDPSSLDQMCQNIYVPSVYFYLNNDGARKLVMERMCLLKRSLSETLCRFYPLAGKVRGNRFIDCNDEGVYYVEAKVNNHIHDILDHPDNKSMHQLLPFEPTSPELVSKSYVVYIKATVFDCGGIAIGLCTSHKIIDGYSLAVFLNAWAATARGSSNNICPSFTSPSVFLHHPSLNSKEYMETDPAQSQCQAKKVTRRFVFSAESLETLKKKSEAPSRALAVIGLVWKSVMSVSTLKEFSSVLMLYVNIREKSSPPLPPFSIGNVFLSAIAQSSGNDRGVSSIVSLLKSAIDKVNSDEIERMKGKDGFKIAKAYYDALQMLMCNRDNQLMLVSSMCNTGIYKADFGWGKPIWARVGSTDSKSNLGINLIYLMDTRHGNGIEALVTLNESDMHVLEQDMELLSYASLNPSPIQTTG